MLHIVRVPDLMGERERETERERERKEQFAAQRMVEGRRHAGIPRLSILPRRLGHRLYEEMALRPTKIGRASLP